MSFFRRIIPLDNLNLKVILFDVNQSESQITATILVTGFSISFSWFRYYDCLSFINKVFYVNFKNFRQCNKLYIGNKSFAVFNSADEVMIYILACALHHFSKLSLGYIFLMAKLSQPFSGNVVKAVFRFKFKHSIRPFKLVNTV